MKISFAYFIWLLSLKLKDLKFQYFLNKPSNIQWKILKKYLKNNKNTIYGRKYNFKNIASIEEFQKNVPIVKYSDIKNYVDNLKEGESRVISGDILTGEKIDSDKIENLNITELFKLSVDDEKKK